MTIFSKWFKNRPSHRDENPPVLQEWIDRLVVAEGDDRRELLIHENPALGEPQTIFMLREMLKCAPPDSRQADLQDLLHWLVQRQARGGKGTPAIRETTQEERQLHLRHSITADQPAPSAGQVGGGVEVPPALQEEIAQLLRADISPANAPALLERCTALLQQADIEQASAVKAAILRLQAIAWYLTRQGDIALNLENALAACTTAGKILATEGGSESWAHLQALHGMLYIFRMRGDPQQNLALSIELLEQALTVFTPSGSASAYASAHNNLGIAWTKRLGPQDTPDFEQALGHFKQAVGAIQAEKEPELWGDIHNNLAGCWAQRISEQGVHAVDEAVHHYRLSLQTLTRDQHPLKYAQANFNLAWMVLQKARLGGEVDLSEAERCAQRSLEAAPYQAWPELWGKTRLALGSMYSLHSPDDPQAVEQAELNFTRALKVFTPETHPNLCLASAVAYGEMDFRLGRISQARTTLETGHRALEAMRNELVSDQSKREIAERAGVLYSLLVRCCLKSGDTAAAFEYASAFKGRSFTDALQSARIDPGTLVEQETEWKRIQALQNCVDALRRRLLEHGEADGEETDQRDGPAQDPRRLGEIRTSMAELSAAWDALTLRHPILQSVQPARPLKLAEACALSRELGADLVEFFDLGEGWGAFVGNAEDMHFVELPKLTDDLIHRLQLWTQRVEQPAGRGKLSLLALEELHRAAIAPLLPLLDPAHLLILAPNGALHLVPLACALNPETQRWVAEDFHITFIPSLNALAALVKRQHLSLTQHAVRFLGVAWPGNSDSRYYLPAARAEVESIAMHFLERHLLVDGEATVQAVLGTARQETYVHFGCHGWFEQEYPDQSGLMLADGWMTVQRILADLRLEAQLVTIGACLGGQASVRRGDDFVGLTQALLSCGAQRIASSLWSVDDVATQVYFEAYYQALSHGAPVGAAARRAAERVRERPEFQHPYYWAAFQLSGLPGKREYE